MNIICTAEMGPGTFEAKFRPLSEVPIIDNIYILRSKVGPSLPKVRYIIYPKIFRNKILKGIFLPIFLAICTLRTKSKVILAYHFTPHAIFAFVASMLTRRPFIYGQTGLYIQKHANQKPWSFIIVLILKKASYINVPGSLSRDFWLRKDILKNRINILHSTIDTAVYKTLDRNFQYDFLILSRLAEVKRIDQLISIFNRMKNKGFFFKVAIIGDGPCMISLKEKVATYELSDDIHFTGFQEKPEIWFNKSKFYVMNSSSEGLPTSLMQAMSCELVSISTNVGNISDMIQHEVNGFLFDVKNSLAFENKLIELLNMDDNTYKKMGSAARATILEFHSDNSVIPKWNQILSAC
jgi:glycosyltransferase involved in cell wall biosynthesis